MVGMLHSLALLKEHSHPLTALLTQQLVTQPATLQQGPQLEAEHLRQLAACLLASQADQIPTPLLAALPIPLRARALEAWRAKVKQRSTTPLNPAEKDITKVLRGMDLKGRAHPITADGCVCPDVAVTLPMNGARYALELLGPHNTTANSGQVLGSAALKMRLLRARGYVVVPIPCAEWWALGRGDLYAKILYLEERFKQRLVGLNATASLISMSSGDDDDLSVIKQEGTVVVPQERPAAAISGVTRTPPELL